MSALTDKVPGNTLADCCPLCDAPLASPDACVHCDWVKGYRHRTSGIAPDDWSALVLSLIPGAGHYYKGHKTMGWLYFAGTFLAGFWCALAATATMGFGLLMLPLYWLWVMTHAFVIQNVAPQTRVYN